MSDDAKSGCASGLAALFEPLALIRVQIQLAQTNGLWRDFDEFIVLYPRKRPFQRHADGWCQFDRFVLTSSADVRELLALEDVHLEIVVARVNAYDHAGIDLDTGVDDHRASIFKVPHGKGYGFA